jgi:hypothetical protein
MLLNWDSRCIVCTNKSSFGFVGIELWTQEPIDAGSRNPENMNLQGVVRARGIIPYFEVMSKGFKRRSGTIFNHVLGVVIV